jgi:hypothetical protein
MCGILQEMYKSADFAPPIPWAGQFNNIDLASSLVDWKVKVAPDRNYNSIQLLLINDLSDLSDVIGTSSYSGLDCGLLPVDRLSLNSVTKVRVT